MNMAAQIKRRRRLMMIGLMIGAASHAKENDGGGSPPAYAPSLDFSDARNSQYIALL